MVVIVTFSCVSKKDLKVSSVTMKTKQNYPRDNWEGISWDGCNEHFTHCLVHDRQS